MCKNEKDELSITSDEAIERLKLLEKNIKGKKLKFKSKKNIPVLIDKVNVLETTINQLRDETINLVEATRSLAVFAQKKNDDIQELRQNISDVLKIMEAMSNRLLPDPFDEPANEEVAEKTMSAVKKNRPKKTTKKVGKQ